MNQPVHPSAERISDLLAGTLPATDAMDVNAHLASCDACGDTRDAVRDLTALLADEGATPVEMPPDVVVALDAAISRASAERAAGIPRLQQVRRAGARRPLKWLAGAAAAVAIAGIGVAGLRAIPHTGSTANSSSAPSNDEAQGFNGLGFSGGAKSADGLPPHNGKVPGQTSALSSITTGQVPAEARRLAAAPAKAVPPPTAHCAVPITGGPSTVVRFNGNRAVLTITRSTRTVTVYDCATATRSLFVTGY